MQDKPGSVVSKLSSRSGDGERPTDVMDMDDADVEADLGSARSKPSSRSRKTMGVSETGQSSSLPSVPLVTGELRRRALDGLASKEKDNEHLIHLRYNLETVRLLADQIKRRERLKTLLSNTKFERLQAMLAEPAKYGDCVEVHRPSPSLAGNASTLMPQRPTAPRTTRPASNKRGPRADAASVSEDIASDAQTVKVDQGLPAAQARRGVWGQRLPVRATPGVVSRGGPGQAGPNTRSGANQRGRARLSQAQNLEVDNSPGPSTNGGGNATSQGPSVGQGGPQVGGSRCAANLWRKNSRSGRKGDTMRLPGERYLNNEELQNLNTELRPRGYAYVSVDQICSPGRRAGRQAGGGVERR